MKNTIKSKIIVKIACFVIASLMFTGFISYMPAKAKSISCKSLCSVVLSVTGGSENLKYQSDNAIDFGAFSASDEKKVKSIQYLCDSKEVYSLCVLQAKSPASAKSLLKQLQKYKKNNGNSGYLQDYSSIEQKVFQNAVCGRKGTYVWYIAMSDTKTANIYGQKAIKKKL